MNDRHLTGMRFNQTSVEIMSAVSGKLRNQKVLGSNK